MPSLWSPEVCRRVEKECSVKITKDPELRVAMGGNSAPRPR